MIDRKFWERVSSVWTKETDGISEKARNDAMMGSGESAKKIDDILTQLANEDENYDEID